MIRPPPKSTPFPSPPLFRSHFRKHRRAPDGDEMNDSRADGVVDRPGQREAGRVPGNDIRRSIRTGGIACEDRKSTRLNSSHSQISYAVFCLKKKKQSSHVICMQETEKADLHLETVATHGTSIQLFRRIRRRYTT